MSCERSTVTPTAEAGDKTTCPARDPWPLSPPRSKLANKELWRQGQADASAQGREGAPRPTWFPVRDLSAGQSFSSIRQHVFSQAPDLGSSNAAGSPRAPDSTPALATTSCALSSAPAPTPGPTGLAGQGHPRGQECMHEGRPHQQQAAAGHPDCLCAPLHPACSVKARWGTPHGPPHTDSTHPRTHTHTGTLTASAAPACLGPRLFLPAREP